MKIAILALFLSLSALAAPKKVKFPEAKAESQRPVSSRRFSHIEDAEGKILATIDEKDGSIDYKENPKEVVKTLISIAKRIAGECEAQCQARLKASQEPKAGKIDVKKKD